ncbi:MAG TPA: type II secretion system protein [Rhodopila sp.]|nr:type II secretion system protein [Rhodopila sp.]
MRGFSLLEVMIALIIAALATTALLRAAGISLSATTEAALYEQAIVRAKSHLDAATQGGALRAGDWQGDDGGGFHWQLRVTPAQVGAVRPFGLVGPRAQTALKVVLYRVVTAISWRQDGRTRMVTLQTEQMGGG